MPLPCWPRACLLLASALLLATATPPAPVAAQEAATGGLGTHDSTQPIEIVADKLTVEQAAGRAVFLGNVIAEQGEMLLQSDKLIVYYVLGDEAATSTQSIRRIEVEGNVTITSAEETAVGDTGFYDVLGERIELAGNVVLTRESNVISGDLLEIDVAQQLATMTAGSDQPQGERVRALFQPAQDGGTSPVADGEG
jgi:lipopolysaccharide export system protein LptA